MSSLYPSNINPSASTLPITKPIIQTTPVSCWFFNASASTQTFYSSTYSTPNPIPGFGATTANNGGDATLMSAMNLSTATFTAPYNGVFVFGGWQAWQGTGQTPNSNYSLIINPSTSVPSQQTSLAFSTAPTLWTTPINAMYTLNAGNTVVFQGTSSAAWGTFNSRLYIEVILRF